MTALLSFGAASPAPAMVHARRWLVLSASVLLAACAAKPVTETRETSAATAHQLVTSDLEVVCRDEIVTGSHFPKRVCRTKKEWGDIADASRGFTQALQSNSTKNLAPTTLPNGVVNPTPIGGPPVY
jgi:hypothetical protein